MLAFDAILDGRTFLVPERYWLGLACVLLPLAFAVRPFAVVNRATAFVGRISYSIYLLHGLVIVVMGRAFLAPYRWGLAPGPAFGVDVLMAFAAVLPIAWVAYELIERPGNRLGTAVVRWLDRGAGLPRSHAREEGGAGSPRARQESVSASANRDASPPAGRRDGDVGSTAAAASTRPSR